MPPRINNWKLTPRTARAAHFQPGTGWPSGLLRLRSYRFLLTYNQNACRKIRGVQPAGLDRLPHQACARSASPACWRRNAEDQPGPFLCWLLACTGDSRDRSSSPPGAGLAAPRPPPPPSDATSRQGSCSCCVCVSTTLSESCWLQQDCAAQSLQHCAAASGCGRRWLWIGKPGHYGASVAALAQARVR
jgi:hypothetical protein